MADQQFSSTSYTYDVFISFRGLDTRNGFIGHLWKALNDRGIHAFIDDKELSRGDEIEPAIFKAIQVSRIAIIVFSEYYAGSKFLLEELAFIVDNFQQRDNLRFIFPVFYNIEPSHVRHQSGPFEAAFVKHEERFHENREKVLKWKTALSQVANLPGWHFEGVEYEHQFLQKIVKEISRRLDPAPLCVTDYPVGLDSRLGEVFRHLELESHEVLTVGIYGIGGIGKTTLAQVVYNTISDQFETSCFLSDIRESSNTQSLAHLQNILLSDMTGLKDIQLRDSSKGISEIKHRLHRKKVLLILDDVDRLEQMEALAGGLDWFGPGSRVVITTRDRHLLAFRGVERRYEVQELNDVDALDLLSHKVFEQGIVDPNYTELLNRAVTYASGLPLALEVIGSSLFGLSVDQCEHALNQFKRILPKDIQRLLRVSFDALDQEVKNIFLDITCCFKGYALADVEQLLCARYGHDLKYHIKVLIDKSLINILDGKVTTTHPLIESMGKEIVREESPEDPGRRSRLWFSEDIVEVLKNNKGTSSIEIIHLDSPLIEDEEAIEWDGKAFKEMPNLKILVIRKCHFSTAPKYLPNSLKVLEWLRYPSEKLPSDFDSKLTKILKVSLADPEVFHLWTTWRVVGLMSSIVGLVCYALSPSFNRLIGKLKAFQIFLYGVLSLAIFTTILFAKESSRTTCHVQLKTYSSFLILMIISVYAFFYDRAVNGKPEILSIVSNAAFALVSLSLRKLINFGFENGVFSYFLGCFTVQLLTINWMFIFVALVFGCPLFVMHSSLNSKREVASGGESNC